MLNILSLNFLASSGLSFGGGGGGPPVLGAVIYPGVAGVAGVGAGGGVGVLISSTGMDGLEGSGFCSGNFGTSGFLGSIFTVSGLGSTYFSALTGLTSSFFGCTTFLAVFPMTGIFLVFFPLFESDLPYSLLSFSSPLESSPIT